MKKKYFVFNKGYELLATTFNACAWNDKSSKRGSTGSNPLTVWSSNANPFKVIIISLLLSSGLLNVSSQATLLFSNIPPLFVNAVASVA